MYFIAKINNINLINPTDLGKLVSGLELKIKLIKNDIHKNKSK